MITAYHRLARLDRTRPYRWWRPAVELAVAGLLFVVLQAVWVVPFLLINGAEQPGGIAEGNPTSMLFGYGAIALTIPAAFVAAWASGRDVRALWSIERRFRWRFFLPALAAFAAPSVLALAVGVLAFGAPPARLDAVFFSCVAITVLLLPLQCLAEELLFRGTLVQSVGAWASSPWVAYLVPVPLFVFGHTGGGGQLVTVSIFALLAALLVHRTGGLELALALHIVNNANVSYANFSGIADLDSLRAFLPVAGLLGAFVLAVLANVVVGTKVAPMPTYDAHLRHLPHPTGDLLFQSAASPAHGGVPVVAPWFAQTLGPQMHGWANQLPWVRTAQGSGTTTAQLTNDHLRLTYTVRTAPDISFSLRVDNLDDVPRRIQLALHPYWAVDAAHARVTGLEGAPYFDKVAGVSRTLEAPIVFGEEVDRVVRTTAQCSLSDAHRTLTFTTHGTDHVVVWNPGPEVCAQDENLGADDWAGFVCVEPALLGDNRDGVVLAPGESAEIGLDVHVTAPTQP